MLVLLFYLKLLDSAWNLNSTVYTYKHIHTCTVHTHTQNEETKQKKNKTNETKANEITYFWNINVCTLSNSTVLWGNRLNEIDSIFGSCKMKRGGLFVIEERFHVQGEEGVLRWFWKAEKWFCHWSFGHLIVVIIERVYIYIIIGHWWAQFTSPCY